VFKRAFCGPVTVDNFVFSEDEDVESFDHLAALFIPEDKVQVDE